MRILHVNRFVHAVGGAESYVRALASLQRDAGDEVEVFGVAPPGTGQERYAKHFPPYVDREGSTAQKAKALGRMMWSTSAIRGIQHVLSDLRPDVVHAHNLYHDLSPAVLQPVRQRLVPCVMTLHDYKLVCPNQEMLAHGQLCDACLPRRYWQAPRKRCKDDSFLASASVAVEAYLHWALRSYDSVHTFICPSRFMVETMTRGGLDPKRLLAVPHFLDNADIPDFSPPGDIVVYIGRLVYAKGVDVLLDAVSRVPDMRLVVAGTGPLEAELKHQATVLAPGRVSFTGQLDRPQVLGLLARARALVLPARWYENQPMSVLEAQAAGVPVVTTNLGGLPELVQHNVTGLVVAAGDAQALAVALRRLVDNPEEAVRLGQAARDMVCSRFAPEDHYQRIREVYNTAIAGAPPGRD